MKRTWTRALAVGLAVGLAGCGAEAPAPEPALLEPATAVAQQEQTTPPGSGLVLDSVTGLRLPLIGEVGDVVIDQAVITNIILVEDVVGQIVGLEAEGFLVLTGGVLGTDVVTEDFRTELIVTRSGPGQCSIISLDLAPITLDVLGGVASVDVPAATIDARGSGLLGPLLCALGALLEPPIQDFLIPVIQAIVQAINAII